MRLRPLALLLVMLGACAPMRHASLPDPAALPAEAPPPAQVEAPRAGAPNCIAHPAIDEWEQRFRTSRRSWVPVVHGERRGARYLPQVRRILVEEGLPTSLALLPAIESGFNPGARGPTGSRGLWQFEAKTARRFGLVVTRRRDDRLDPERSTRAAIRYLRKLHARYDDWPLALAAYNAGEGRVDAALARAPGATFWELADAGLLPPISCAYVPRFLALVRLVDRDELC
jgi:hypothetical protein